jgi:hypothetical protein
VLTPRSLSPAAIACRLVAPLACGGDGKNDLLSRDTRFCCVVQSTASFGNVPTNWTVQSVNAELRCVLHQPRRAKRGAAY